MIIREIIIKYLKENEYDGLYHRFGVEEPHCKCTIDEICEVLYDDCQPFKNKDKK